MYRLISRAEKLEREWDHNLEKPRKIDKLQPKTKLEPTKIKIETKTGTSMYLSPEPEPEPQKNELVSVSIFKILCIQKS